MTDDEFTAARAAYRARFGVEAPWPAIWPMEDLVEIWRRAIDTGIPIPEGRFDPPEGCDS